MLISLLAQSRATLFKIRTDFRKALIDVLISSLAPEEEGKRVTIDPISLRLVSETTRKDTLLTMENLAQRLQAPQTPGLRRPNPDDVLPSFPSPPRREASNVGPTALPYSENPTPQRNDQRASSPVQGSPNLSQASFASPRSPGPRPIPAPLPILNPPIPNDVNNANRSQSLIRRMPSRSVLSRMFSSTPRPYYQLSPHPLTPAVVPSYKCTEDSEDVLEEGREAIDRLWAAADSARDMLEVGRPHSAPLLQAPWDMFMEDEFCSSAPLPAQDVMPSQSEYLMPPPHQGPVSHGSKPSLEPGKRIRSEPALTFSKPPPRFKRNVSGPPGPN